MNTWGVRRAYKHYSPSMANVITDAKATTLFTVFTQPGLEVSITGGDLVVTNTDTTDPNQGARSRDAKTTGRFYYEATLTNLTAGVNNGFGVGTNESDIAGLGNSATEGGLVYPSLGNSQVWAHGSQVVAAALGFPGTNGYVYAVACDTGSNLVWFKILGVSDWNGSMNGNPAGGTGGVAIFQTNWEPVCTFGGLGCVSGNIFSFNFGQNPFAGAVPGGFTPGWTRN